MEESTRLASSSREGSRQPFWPPMLFSRQARWARVHLALVVCGDFSQIRPVCLSNTASLPKAGKVMNRCADGRALSLFWVTPGTSADFPCSAAVASVQPKPAKRRPISAGAPLVTVITRRFIVLSISPYESCALDPLLSFEKPQHGDRDRHHHAEHQRVAPFPL